MDDLSELHLLAQRLQTSCYERNEYRPTKEEVLDCLQTQEENLLAVVGVAQKYIGEAELKAQEASKLKEELERVSARKVNSQMK
jgi:hypothetical protein